MFQSHKYMKGMLNRPIKAIADIVSGSPAQCELRATLSQQTIQNGRKSRTNRLNLRGTVTETLPGEREIDWVIAFL
jgi:hypothetical protein